PVTPDQKPASDQKPADEQKSGADQKSAAAQTPVADQKPADAQTPAAGQKPATDERPATQQQPSSEQKPAGDPKPADGSASPTAQTGTPGPDPAATAAVQKPADPGRIAIVGDVQQPGAYVYKPVLLKDALAAAGGL